MYTITAFGDPLYETYKVLPVEITGGGKVCSSVFSVPQNFLRIGEFAV